MSAYRVVLIIIESLVGLETLVEYRSSIPLQGVSGILLLISISSFIGRDILYIPTGL
jgi:hypothetical protein